ncbi:hypothetical protein [Aequorivita lipolytica]|nr:hypothetical protein [Aequorivita lipolytica]
MEVTKKDIEKLIEQRKKDSLINHLWNSLSGNFRPQGDIYRNHIKVWKQNIWFGSFYAIFKFDFNANNHLINITDKLNSFGKLLIGFISGGFIFAVFPENPIEFDYLDNWLPIFIVIIFLFILIFVFRKLYLFERKNQLDEIFEYLNMEIEEEKPEKEWFAKNILIRLFTYPFCLFLIGINIFLIIPNGQYLLAIGSLTMVSFYIIADLKMILRRKTTGNNV